MRTEVVAYQHVLVPLESGGVTHRMEEVRRNVFGLSIKTLRRRAEADRRECDWCYQPYFDHQMRTRLADWSFEWAMWAND